MLDPLLEPFELSLAYKDGWDWEMERQTGYFIFLAP